jgi:hypothetical protein
MVWKMNKIPPSHDRAIGNQALCSRCLGGEIKNHVNPVNRVRKYFGFSVALRPLPSASCISPFFPLNSKCEGIGISHHPRV